jgi:hypothetical protein
MRVKKRQAQNSLMVHRFPSDCSDRRALYRRGRCLTFLHDACRNRSDAVAFGFFAAGAEDVRILRHLKIATSLNYLDPQNARCHP